MELLCRSMESMKLRCAIPCIWIQQHENRIDSLNWYQSPSRSPYTDPFSNLPRAPLCIVSTTFSQPVYDTTAVAVGWLRWWWRWLLHCQFVPTIVITIYSRSNTMFSCGSRVAATATPLQLHAINLLRAPKLINECNGCCITLRFTWKSILCPNQWIPRIIIMIIVAHWWLALSMVI